MATKQTALVAPMARITRADLAFVDAAIRLLQASRAGAASGPSIDASDAAADEVVITATVVSTVQYQVFISSGLGSRGSAVELANRIGLAPSISLTEWIAARNRLAAALGEEEM